MLSFKDVEFIEWGDDVLVQLFYNAEACSKEMDKSYTILQNIAI